MAEAVEDLEAVGTDPTTLRSNEGVAGRSGSPFFIPPVAFESRPVGHLVIGKMIAGAPYAAV